MRGIALALALVLVAPTPALAANQNGECTRVGDTIRCGVDSVVVDPGTSSVPGGGGSGGEQEPPQSTRPQPPPRYGCSTTTLTDAQAREEGLAPRPGGSWVRRSCTFFNGPTIVTHTWRRDSQGPGAPAQPPQALVDRARDSLRLPAPVIRMNPRVEWEQIVHLPTWLWIDPGGFQRRQAEASIPGVTVTATAVPRRVVWTMGNGDQTTCTTAGTPYDERRSAGSQRTDCSYTYRHSSDGQPQERYPVTATVEYDATWTATGVPGGGSLGTIRRSSTVRIRVAELQALNQ